MLQGVWEDRLGRGRLPVMATSRAIPCNHSAPAAGCAFCAVAAADPRYAALFGLRAAPPASSCAFLGAPTGEVAECPSCNGRVRLKLFACAKHGRCTLGKPAPGVACCRGCPDHSGRQAVAPAPPAITDPVTTRDVLYHLYPLPGEAGAVWRQRLGMLLRRAVLFNGRKVISCMTGSRLEHPRAVRELAEPHGFEVIEVANDPALREAKSLIELLPTFHSLDPHRALFFAHAKAVTRPADRGNACHPWALVCHEVCLDYWPLVERTLQKHPVAGPFKKVGPAFAGSRSSWHYSGGVYWLRSADLFGRRAWRDVERRWFASESQVGVWYRPEEAGCLFDERPMGQMDLYSLAQMREALLSYSWWKAEMDPYRTDWRALQEARAS